MYDIKIWHWEYESLGGIINGITEFVSPSLTISNFKIYAFKHINIGLLGPKHDVLQWEPK